MSPLAAKILAAVLFYLHQNGNPEANPRSSFQSLGLNYFDYVEIQVRLDCRHGVDLEDEWNFRWDTRLRDWAQEATRHVLIRRGD